MLGPRLVACCRALAGLATTDADDVLGPVDGQKLRSSMTLFARAAPAEPIFGQVLDRYFDGTEDDATVRLLAGS